MGHESMRSEENNLELGAEIRSLLKEKGFSLEGLTLESVSPPVTGAGVRLVKFTLGDGGVRVFQVDTETGSASEWNAVERP